MNNIIDEAFKQIIWKLRSEEGCNIENLDKIKNSLEEDAIIFGLIKEKLEKENNNKEIYLTFCLNISKKIPVIDF